MAKMVAPEKMGWLDHRDALSWLWLLYSKPEFFTQQLSESGRWLQIRLAVAIYLHFAPYLIVFTLLSRLFIFNVLGSPTPEGSSPTLYWHIGVLSFVLAIGMAAIIVGRSAGNAFGIAIGIAIGIAGGSTAGITTGVSGGIAVGIAYGTAFGAFVGISFGTSKVFDLGTRAGAPIAIAGGYFLGKAFGIAGDDTAAATFTTSTFATFFCLCYYRLYYYPFHILAIWPNPLSRYYHRHPVAWDDFCMIPFKNLHRLLVALTKENPEYGEAEIERLITSYPSQRNEALIARTILLGEKACKMSDLSQLETLTNLLPEGDKGYLKQTTIIRENAAEIVRQRLLVNSADRAYMRKAHLEHLVTKIESLQHQVAGFHEPLASGFGKAAKKWLRRTKDELLKSQTLVGHEPILQVFRAGDPVDREQEAFVPRLETMGRVERQLTMAKGCPGLLLYGRRRMGKSTLLRNLQSYLPQKFRLAQLSLQNPKNFTSPAMFFTSLNQVVEKAAPKLVGQSAEILDLSAFYDRLTHWNQTLAVDERLLLALDEYEMLDRKIGEGVFPEDLLATLRESMQNHRRLVWMLSGSHDTRELSHADWESYLVSIRTVEVPFFSLEETHLLLTDPLSRSNFWGERKDRPRMDASFWGKDGVQRIHHWSGGWPHLVQLMAETLVDMANDYEKARITDKIFQKSLDESATAGSKVLFQLMLGECKMEREQGYLFGFLTSETQEPPRDPQVAANLRHRKLVLEENGLWRLRAPLMRHWLKRNG